MSLTLADDLSRILPAVISGGRPQLRQRPVARLLRDLHGVTADPVWVVMDKDAAGYEEDGHEISVYSRTWAEDYAAGHWTALSPPEPGGFLGAFPGREWACRLAEERGCWAVLQLDDNITRLNYLRTSSACMRIVDFCGGLGMFADVLAAVTLSTNGRMTGAFLSSVAPTAYSLKVSRTGFPYSLFLERTGPGREEWHGPFEDDITHAYQYGSSAGQDTALVVPVLQYTKESSSRTGMRGTYGHDRAVSLQRMFPETARVNVRKTHSNGLGKPRVFHTMIPGAIRTPMIITDHDLYGRVTAYLENMGRELGEMRRQDNRAKINRRAARWRDQPPPGTPQEPGRVPG
jgi:TET-Associated Glycosyltransferase